VLRALASAGLRIGLISNSHRCLDAFQSHFELGGLIAATISGPEHGFMKPSPTIFQAALQRTKVAPGEALMVGDSVRQDVEGALRAGMRAVLLHRGVGRHPEEEQLAARGVSILRTLTELPAALTLARAP
jgi:putative hydrolase of the HAD superfamily